MNFIISYTTCLHLQIQIDVMLTGCSLGNVVNYGAMNMIGMGSFLKCGKKGKRVEKGRVNGVKGLEVLMGERGLGMGRVRG